MFQAVLVLAGLAGGLPPAEMAEVVARYYTRFDKMVVEVSLAAYGLHGDVPTLDRASWTPIGQYPYRLTIVRPNLRIESLRDDPDEGYEPTNESIYENTYVARSVRRVRDGKWYYTIHHGTWHEGSVTSHPILQVFGFQMFEALMYGREFNLVHVLQHPSARLVGHVASVSTYTASVRIDPYRYAIHYQIDLAQCGLALRVRSVFDFFDDPEHPSVVDEQRVLSTMNVAGQELPAEVVVTRTNPKVPQYHSICVYHVTDVASRPELTDADVRIEVERRNAFVYETDRRKGTKTIYTYDEAGNEVEASELNPATPIDGDNSPPESLTWRRAVAPAAAVVGLTVALGLGLVARRARHRSERS